MLAVIPMSPLYIDLSIAGAGYSLDSSSEDAHPLSAATTWPGGLSVGDSGFFGRRAGRAEATTDGTP